MIGVVYMFLRKLRICNYKGFKDRVFDFSDKKNIIVGENEVGKSTIVEAIQMVLTGKFENRNVFYSLNAHIFNCVVVKEYIDKLQAGENPILPKIVIEAYFNDSSDLVNLKGKNNLLDLNVPGVFLEIVFDENYRVEYEEYIKNKEEILTVPIEYYKVNWYSFAYETVTQRSIPIKTVTIDNTNIKNDFNLNNYISRVINDSLSNEQKASLSLGYRKLTEMFSYDTNIKKINQLLEQNNEISDKSMKLSIETSTKNSWERNVNLHLDDIPFDYVGAGEKNKVHTLLSLLMDDSDSKIVLIEEPENNLSYGNMRKLINSIATKSEDKQLIITTHNPYILNKLGIESTILLKGDNEFKLDELSSSTKEYFKKLPGYDTLRVILSSEVIFVEGPSDELIIKKAFLEKYGSLPMDKGIDIVCVNGLSFKRFLEIVSHLDMEAKVVTDNDGDIEKNIIEKYAEYTSNEKIKIFYDINIENYTLEVSIASLNKLKTLNEILNKSFNSKEELLDYMLKNKTKSALMIFESEKSIEYPEYIKNVIE